MANAPKTGSGKGKRDITIKDSRDGRNTIKKVKIKIDRNTGNTVIQKTTIIKTEPAVVSSSLKTSIKKDISGL